MLIMRFRGQGDFGVQGGVSQVRTYKKATLTLDF